MGSELIGDDKTVHYSACRQGNVAFDVRPGAQVIDFGDRLICEVQPEGSTDLLTCTLADVPTDETNLVNKVWLSCGTNKAPWPAKLIDPYSMITR